MNINKKIFASALFIVGAFVSSIASAAITYTNSKDYAGDAQNANAVAVAGGGSVRANNLILSFGGGADVAADKDIIVRLPEGFNFAADPEYLVERSGGATATTGLTLKDKTEFGDPTLDDPKITLNDTDGDGKNDRALVTVSSANTAADTLTISIWVTADTATAGKGKKASVIVAGGLADTQEIADVVTSLSTPVSSAATGQAKVDQNLNESADTSGADFVVTIPAGTAGGTSLTLKPNSGITWGTLGSTITWTVHTPGFAVDALTPTSASNVVGAASSTSTITLKTNWASSAKNSSAIQVKFDISELNSAAGKTGLRGLAVGGVVTGNAQLVEVLANGSEAKLSTTPKAPSIVAGSSAAQTLPTIEVTENFNDDLGGSFTITAGTGLTFISGGSVKAGAVTGTIAVNATSTVITVTVGSGNGANGASKTISITGITGIASSTASGDLSVTVDSTTAAAKYGPKADVLTVASAVDVGGVDLSILSAQVRSVGKDKYVATSTITVKEETYGAISNAAKTQVQDAYFRITPSSNADIKAVAVSTSGYAGGTSPTIAISTPCAAENGVTTGAWLCEVEAESTAVVPGTSTVSVQVTYITDKAAVGDTVDMVFDGNAEVAGSVTVANVKIATAASVTTAIPGIEAGSDIASKLATVQIKENFANAVTAKGSFRLVAPQGVAFQDAASVQAQASIGTATITATFNPNDTLVMTAATTQTITFQPKAVIADGKSGKLSFTIYDGDIEGKGGAGVTSEQVIIAYGGLVDKLDSGDDTDVTVGFKTSNTVEGGLAPYTVKSGNTGFATVTIDGTKVTVTGVGAGVATITVTDDLGATDSFDVTVATGGTQPDATKAAKALDGSTTAATFTAGASSDGGITYGTEFTTADSVTLVGTINVDPADQGSDGEVHVLVSSVTGAGVSIFSLDVDGKADAWDGSLEDIAANIVATPLGASYTVTIVSDEMLAAGTYRVALAYSTEGGKLVYTAKAMVITVTE